MFFQKLISTMCSLSHDSRCPPKRASRPARGIPDTRVHGDDRDGGHEVSNWQADRQGDPASTFLLCFVVLIGMFVFASRAFTQSLDATKAGVVKITTATGQTGTGFIVRVESEVVYIITAAHVIAGDNQPKVEFFTKRNVPIKGTVLPGAEVNDDIRGLALVVVRGKDHIPENVTTLSFQTSLALVSGGEKVLVIGHPGGGGDWAVVNRDVSNRMGRDLTLDPGLASRFSGAPIIVGDEVVGMVMSNRGEFGLGLTHKSVLNYIEGFGVVPTTSLIVDQSESDSSVKPLLPTVQLEQSSSDPRQALPQTKTGRDGAPMVLVPAGEFLMGSIGSIGKNRRPANEQPAHYVDLDSFYIDQYEVTVERYQRFKKQARHREPKYWEQVNTNRDGQKPVVGVDWHDATAYCAWAEKRLPTEAEWEKAARGTDKRIYPWGTTELNSNTANFAKSLDLEKVYEQKLKEVGRYEHGKSPYGAYDMAGNVWEWVADWYDKEYYRISPRKNPQGPSSGEKKVLRGGSWAEEAPTYLRSALRLMDTPTEGIAHLGFRCAQDAR